MRSYPWGTAEALRSKHSDVLALRRLLFELSFDTLKRRTDDRYYKFRAGRLSAATKAPEGAFSINLRKFLSCAEIYALSPALSALYRLLHQRCCYGVYAVACGSKPAPIVNSCQIWALKAVSNLFLRLYRGRRGGGSGCD